MNTTVLLEVIDLLLRLEGQFSIQNRLVGVRDALANLASNPSVPQFQADYDGSLRSLDDAAISLVAELDSRQKKLINQIEGGDFFSENLANFVRERTQSNAVTLSLASNEIAVFVEERQQFLGHLQNSKNAFAKFNVGQRDEFDYRAEVVAQFPRLAFGNNLSGLLTELKYLRLFLTVSADIAGEPSSDMEIHSISTSEPTFSIGMAVKVVAIVGGLITWGLDTWERVERIRALRASAAEIQSSALDKAREEIEKAIKAEIDRAIEARMNMTQTGDSPDDTSKRHALELLLSWIERGVQLEVRYMLYENDPSTDANEDQEAVLSFSKQANRFPSAAHQPFLLPRPNVNGEEFSAASTDNNK